MSNPARPSVGILAAANHVLESAMASDTEEVFFDDPRTVSTLLSTLLSAFQNLVYGRIPRGDGTMWPSVGEAEIHFASLILAKVAAKQGSLFARKPQQAARIAERLVLYFSAVGFVVDDNDGTREWLKKRLSEAWVGTEQYKAALRSVENLPKLQPYEVNDRTNMFAAFWGEFAPEISVQNAPQAEAPAVPRLTKLEVNNGDRFRSQDGRNWVFTGTKTDDPGRPDLWVPVMPLANDRTGDRGQHRIDAWTLTPSKADEYRDHPTRRAEDARNAEYGGMVKRNEPEPSTDEADKTAEAVTTKA